MFKNKLHELSKLFIPLSHIDEKLKQKIQKYLHLVDFI